MQEVILRYLSNDKIAVDFKYDLKLTEKLGNLSNRRFDNEKKQWIIDASEISVLKKYLEDNNYKIIINEFKEICKVKKDGKFIKVFFKFSKKMYDIIKEH